MTALRQLRKDATAAAKRARSSCAAAERDARQVAKTRCQFVKERELREAKTHCDLAYKHAEAARAVYRKARPELTPATARARAKAGEGRDVDRRNAVARVVEEHQVPELVAEYAVRQVERRGLRATKHAHRWERLAEGVTGRELAAAWKRQERELEAEARKAAPRPKRAKVAPVRRRAAGWSTRKRKAAPAPDVVVLYEDDFDVF